MTVSYTYGTIWNKLYGFFNYSSFPPRTLFSLVRPTRLHPPHTARHPRLTVQRLQHTVQQGTKSVTAANTDTATATDNVWIISIGIPTVLLIIPSFCHPSSFPPLTHSSTLYYALSFTQSCILTDIPSLLAHLPCVQSNKVRTSYSYMTI